MADPRKAQASVRLTFLNVTTSETARQAVTLQGPLPVPAKIKLDGYTLMRTGGSDGDVVTTVRLWDASSSGYSVYQNDHTLGANDDCAGVLGLGLPLDSADFSELNASLQNDTGTTQDYSLIVYFRTLVD